MSSAKHKRQNPCITRVLQISASGRNTNATNLQRSAGSSAEHQSITSPDYSYITLLLVCHYRHCCELFLTCTTLGYSAERTRMGGGCRSCSLPHSKAGEAVIEISQRARFRRIKKKYLKVASQVKGRIRAKIIIFHLTNYRYRTNFRPDPKTRQGTSQGVEKIQEEDSFKAILAISVNLATTIVTNLCCYMEKA